MVCHGLAVVKERSTWTGLDVLLSLRRLSGTVPITVASQQDGRGLDVNPGLSVWS